MPRGHSSPQGGRILSWVGKSQIARLVIMTLATLALFLPWINVRVSTLNEQLSSRNYGYHYMVPSEAALVAPLALLSLGGIIIAAISIKASNKIRLFCLLGGLLIIGGVAASFAYTLSSAMSRVSGSSSFSVDVFAEYGAGLEILFAFLLMASGVLARRFEPINRLETLSPP